MRALLGALAVALMGSAIALCGNLEVFAGSLPGPRPRHDAHSSYVRSSTASGWQKSSSTPAFSGVLDTALRWDSDSPSHMPAMVSHLTGWLIDHNHRNVFLDPAAGWNARGQDFDQLLSWIVDRPVEAREKTTRSCALAFDRFTGRLVEVAAHRGLCRQLAPLVLRPAPNSSEPQPS